MLAFATRQRRSCPTTHHHAVLFPRGSQARASSVIATPVTSSQQSNPTNFESLSDSTILAQIGAAHVNTRSSCSPGVGILRDQLSLNHGNKWVPSTLYLDHSCHALKRRARLTIPKACTGARLCSSQHGTSEQTLFPHSGSLTVPTTRPNRPSLYPLRDQHGDPTSKVPAVYISAASEEESNHIPCKGLRCPFYAKDERKYAQCIIWCTTGGKDPFHHIQRHLDKHKGDVSDAALDRAKASFKVNGQEHFDRRRTRNPEEKLSDESKLKAMYEQAQRELFRGDGRASSYQCQHRYGHIVRRRRSSRITNGTAERDRISRSRNRTSRSTSRASSVAIEAHRVSEDGSEGWRTDIQAFNRDFHPTRVDLITQRLCQFSRTSSTNPRANAVLQDLLGHLEDQLEALDRQFPTANGGASDAQMVSTSWQDPESSFTPNFGFLPQPSYEQLSPSTPTRHYPRGENDIDLSMEDRDFELASGPALPLPQGQSYVPQEATWQRSLFGRHTLSTGSMQESSQPSRMSEPFAYTTQTVSPSSASVVTPASQAVWQNYLPFAANEQDTTFFTPDDVMSHLGFQSEPYLQDRTCGICGQSSAICDESQHMLMPGN